MGLTGWPLVVDDDGTGQSGTAADKAWSDAVKASIEDSLFSATNPSVSPADTTDEVVEARGTEASLADRLATALELDGDLIIPESVMTETEDQYYRSRKNLIINDQFLLWHLGDALAPTGWTLAGAGATIARTGNGLGDTNRKHGLFAAKVTAPLDVKTTLTQTLLDAAVVGTPGFMNYKLSVGVRSKATVASRVTISVNDGVTETTSTAHSGSGVGGPEGDGWEWLSVTHVISPTATQLAVVLNIATGASISAYWSGVTAILSEIAPGDWFPALMVEKEYFFNIAGTPATGNDKFRFVSREMGIVTDVQLSAITAPGVGGVTVDVNTWDGAAFTSIFAGGSEAKVANGANYGNQAPGGTYARRCFTGMYGSAAVTGAIFRIDLDAINAGADIGVHVRVKVYPAPLASVLAYDDLG
jgi:hypothetical protein